MKVYRFEVMFLDFDGIGFAAAQELIEETRYPNHIIAPVVFGGGVREVDWNDAHPLNNHRTAEAEFRRLFSEDPDAQTARTKERERMA